MAEDPPISLAQCFLRDPLNRDDLYVDRLVSYASVERLASAMPDCYQRCSWILGALNLGARLHYFNSGGKSFHCALPVLISLH